MKPGFKQGKASCGVARQYTGSAGKITNCQIGVFAAYVSRHGHAFIDRALYLPKGWTDDPARLKATSVPDNVSFSTKPQLAVEMIERALAAGVPFRWVAADSVYGVGDIERNLRQAGKGYVLGVNSNHWFASWGKPQRVAGTAEEIAKTQRRSDWRRLSAGAGTKGPRLHDWCYLELADLEGEDSNHHSQVLWTRGLLIRRNIANGDLAYFTTWCPAGTSIKNEFGLDHNECRSWHGWHRHVSLVMLAFAMMAAIQHQANAQKNQVERNAKTSDLIPWSIQEIRRIAQRLARKRIQPADVIAWSLWRRAHQAAAQKSHFKQKSQL